MRNTGDVSALRRAIQIVRRGESLLVFPEGRRMERGKELSQPESGIGFIVAKAGAPVIPAFIKGTERALPRGAKFIFPAKIQVFFGSQINIDGYMEYGDISKLIMERIRLLAVKS